MATKTEIDKILVEMGYEIKYITRAFDVLEKYYGSDYNVENLTEIISRLQNKDRQTARIENPYNIGDKVMAYKRGSCDHKWKEAEIIGKENSLITIRFNGSEYIEGDDKLHIIRDKTKFRIVKKTENTLNLGPWKDIIGSDVVHVPQWVKCDLCEKWRIIHVLKEDIISWKEPVNWACWEGNHPNDNCEAPQQQPGASQYDAIQLRALTIQREIKVNLHGKEEPEKGSESIRDRKRKNLDDDMELEPVRKKQRICDFDDNITKDICDLYKQANEKLILQVKDLEEQIKKVENDGIVIGLDTKNIETLDEEQLNELEIKLQERHQENLKRIRDARDKLKDDKMRCMVCLKNQKDIVIQGCNHFDLCNDCESKLDEKACPRCNQAYTDIIRLNV